MKLIKIILSCIVLMFLWCSDSFAATAASCSYEDVYSAYIATSAGQTLTIPPCESTSWGSNMLTVTRAIKIVGAGKTKTFITGTNSSSLIRVNLGSYALFPFELTGLDLTINSTSGQILYVNGAGYGWRIYNNNFTNAVTAKGVMQVTPANGGGPWPKGLIDNNTFLDIAIIGQGAEAHGIWSWESCGSMGN